MGFFLCVEYFDIEPCVIQNLKNKQKTYQASYEKEAIISQH